MREYWTLVIKNSLRSKRRTALTIASIAVSLCLLTLLLAVYRALFLAPELTPGQALRLVTHHKVSLTQDLPVAYEEKIEQISGVRAVTSLRWFGGMYKDASDPRNQFARFAIEPQSFFEVYPEVVLPRQQASAFQEQKTACIASQALADRLGWTLGERIVLMGDTTPITLELSLVGIFSEPAHTPVLYFNRAYLEDSLPPGDPRRGTVQQFYVGAASKGDVPRIASTIDALFENSPAPTMTESEHAFMLSFASFLGNVKVFLLAIGCAVTFTILLVLANTISMSTRERFREVGILKTLGFTRAEILMMIAGESAVIGLAGGALGCMFATMLCAAISKSAAHGANFLQMLKTMAVTPAMTLLILSIAVVVATFSAFVPALSAARISIVKSLGYTG
jgi:putative ABC transport system permease protein